MKAKLFFAALVFICYYGATGLSASNGGFVRPSTTPEKLKSGFNSGSVSMHALAFTENKGQVRGFDGSPQPGVKFAFKQGNTQLFLLETGIAYQFTRTHLPEGYAELISKRPDSQDLGKLQQLQARIRTETFRMDMTLQGANANPKITTEGKSGDYINYYNFNVLDVHSFSTITYHDIYPGIDWVIYTKNGQVKYDFVVSPGADPSLIKMQFTHQEELALNPDGSFTLTNRLGSIGEKKPLSYQQGKEIATGFLLKGNVISFVLGAYDRNTTLVIDPAVVWATYYGGSATDVGISCTADAFGNIYLSGYTASTTGIALGGHQNTITAGGYPEAFLVKFNSNGIRQWATYYGGSDNDIGANCCTDAAGNIYMSGNTGSSSGIASGGHQNIYGGDTFDAFLVKFNTNGVRQWATYYGGSGDDFATKCATDAVGNIYLVGETESSFAIASGGHQNLFAGIYDAFLVKFNSSGVRLWGTYYGGTGFDGGWSCSTDLSGNVYVAGNASSSAGIASGGYQNTMAGVRDAFLVKFNGGGIRQWATYYGGSGFEDGWSCTTDPAGNVFLAGYTASTVGIASGGHQNIYAGGFHDAFLVKFDSNGSRLWATYYGGTSDDWGYSCVCATDNAGNIFLAGETQSTAGIASAGYQNVYGGGITDVFLVKFNSSGVRQWGTYYGDNNEDSEAFCATDVLGNIYLSGITASTANIASGGHQNTYGGGSKDAFLVKFCDQSPAQPSAVTGNTFVCLGGSYDYSIAPSATGYTWSAPGGWLGSSSGNSITATILSSGVLSVTVSNACGVSPAQTLSITAAPVPTIAVNSGTICSGEIFTIVPSGAAGYTITGGSIMVSPLSSSAYSVTGTSSTGCVSSNTAVANIVVDQCTLLNEIEGQNHSVDVFPNPTRGSFEIRSLTPMHIVLYNEIGQLVWETDREMLNQSVNVRGLAQGIYFAHLISGSGSSVKKIVVVSD